MMISSIGIKAIKKVGTSTTLRSAGTLAGHYSFASPEADFYNTFLPRNTDVDSSIPQWSRSLSFAAPENDFVAANVNDAPEREASSSEWSGTLSFASPEADYTADPEAPDSEWSENMSFASPEADFTAQPERASEWEWSEQLSFASPESDFVAQPERASEWEWSEQLSFASPESDFVAPLQATTETTVDAKHDVEADALKTLLMNSPIMSLAISSPESASGSLHAHHLLEHHELYKLHQERTTSTPLPSTVEEALSGEEHRAIVVTEAQSPFNIVDVNDAWVGLCGFSKEEARDQTLSLIQGPDTNQRALGFMLDDLLHGREATALVTNYDKTGRKFYNKLKAGPIKDANDRITHLVGILQEVTEEPEYFHNVALHA